MILAILMMAAAAAASPQDSSDPIPSVESVRVPTPAVAPPSDTNSFGGIFDLLSVLDADFELGPWKLRGYIQYDFAAYDQATAGPPETDFRRGPSGEAGLDARALNDGALLRRARFGGQGTIGRDVAYRAMFELGQESTPRVAEVWISYNRFKPYSIQVGAFPPPANMEDATSTDNALFLERATAANLARSFGAGDGRIGLTVRRSSQRGMAAVSLTGPVLDHAEDYSPRSAIVARVLQRVSHTPARSLYLGLSSNWVLEPSGKGASASRPPLPVRLEAAPEILVDDTPLIDTNFISAQRAHVWGMEFAAQQRNLLFQSEAFRFEVERQPDNGLSDPHFWGFYVQGAWQLTGEQRRFDPVRGAFWFPAPSRPLGGGGFGAVELALRYSRMNLNYRAGVEGNAPPPDGVRGGDQEIVSASLEWFPRRRFRVMLNALHVNVDRLNPASAENPEPFGPPPLTPPIGVRIGQSFNIFAIRGRYAF